MTDPIIEESYEEAKRKAKDLYSKIGTVWCPVLKNYVAFNSSGFRHLIWQGNAQRRKREQMRRFGLVSQAVSIIGIAESFEYRNEEQISTKQWNGIKTRTKSQVQFWGFSGIVGEKHVRVVIRQVGNGKKHFFSIFQENKQKSAS